MGSPDKEDIDKWFDELCGVDRKKIKLQTLSSSQRKTLLSRDKMKNRLTVGLKQMMDRREEKGQMAWSFKKHIVYKQRVFKAAHKRFVRSIQLSSEGEIEKWKHFGKVLVIRKDNGRIQTWAQIQ